MKNKRRTEKCFVSGFTPALRKLSRFANVTERLFS